MVGAYCSHTNKDGYSIRLFRNNQGGLTMWTKPEATEMRFGFEVTMYVCNR
jgi:pyrroloquinoline quinone biosynthesis protein A